MKKTSFIATSDVDGEDQLAEEAVLQVVAEPNAPEGHAIKASKPRYGKVLWFSGPSTYKVADIGVEVDKLSLSEFGKLSDPPDLLGVVRDTQFEYNLQGDPIALQSRLWVSGIFTDDNALHLTAAVVYNLLK